jgi:hypothetical protein
MSLLRALLPLLALAGARLPGTRGEAALGADTPPEVAVRWSRLNKQKWNVSSRPWLPGAGPWLTAQHATLGSVFRGLPALLGGV